MSTQAPTPEFARAFCDTMLNGFDNEVQTTKKVLACIPDDKRDYRPDPHARTAKELAWHIANTDIQFLDGIADMKFSMESPENKPQSSAEVVSWYDENMKRGIARIAQMTPEQLITPVEFFGVFNLPV